MVSSSNQFPLMSRGGGRCILWYTCVAIMLSSMAYAEQVDISITETSSGVTVTIQGSLDTSSGLTFMGSDASNSIDPLLKVGSSSDDGTEHIMLLDQKSTALSYYLVENDGSSSWNFDCIAKPTDLFKFIDIEGDDGLEKSIGIIVTNGGETSSVVLTADADYSSTMDETGTISVDTVEELGLIPDTTCFMAFGNNRIQVQVGTVVNGTNEEDEEEKTVNSPPSTLPVASTDTTPPTVAPSSPSSVVMISPTGVPCDFLDLFCQGAKLIGGLNSPPTPLGSTDTTPTVSPSSSSSVTISPTGVPCDLFDLVCQGAKLVGGLF